MHASISVHGRTGVDRPAAIPVQGSKNCFNHIIPAAFAAGPDTTFTLRATPGISDRQVVRRMLAETGVDTTLTGSDLVIQGGPDRPVISPELGRRLRVTICYAAALAARLGCAWCSMPGGDAFTARPIDAHLRVLEAAGAHCTVHTGSGALFIRFARQPTAAQVHVGTAFGPSMGASVTGLTVAALADGMSTLAGLSVEPEVLGLISVLRQLGVEIEFDGPRTVRVHGVGGPLSGKVTAAIPPDRMEAGTYLLAGLTRYDRTTVSGIRPADFPAGFHEVMAAMGVELLDDGAGTTAIRRDLRPADVVTRPHPGFPTDLQPQLAAFLTQAEGRSSVTETIYRTRTTHVPELAKLGVDIAVRGQRQEIAGRQRPRGGDTVVTDIRCGAAVLVAATTAGAPVVLADPAGHLARGYSDLPGKLSRLGLAVRPIAGSARTAA